MKAGRSTPPDVPARHRRYSRAGGDALHKRRVWKPEPAGAMHSQQLEYFCKVAEFGSLSRAAVFLGINQSALSRHIRNLESDLGVALFYRNGRGVVLTEHGERLQVRAARVMEEIALAKQEALNARQQDIESVAIGLTPTVGRILVRPLARQITAGFPNIRLRFVEGFSGHLLELLESGRIDIAVLYQGWAGGRIHAERLITEKLCLACSTKFKPLKPKTPTAQLAEFPLIMPSAPHSLRRLVDLVAVDQKLNLNIAIEVDAFESKLMLVKDGLGYTVVPACAIQDELKSGQLQASVLVKPEVTRTLVLATPSSRPTARGLTQIARTIRTEVKKFEHL
jgi:LysR family transcriptional regulator, nitrogen assimilation regulatory protein